MLKLVSALEMNFESVKDYDKSYLKTPSFACYTVVTSRRGKKTYYDYVRAYSPNMYYLVDERYPDYILGYGDIDLGANYHEDNNNKGHISYDIRPSERGMGYGNEILGLLLIKCAELGMDEICISCLKTNIPSKKIIEKHGAVLEKEFENEFGKTKALKYWIDLGPVKEKMGKVIR